LALSFNRLVFWDEFSVWSVTIGIRANSEWWPGGASRDQRGR